MPDVVVCLQFQISLVEIFTRSHTRGPCLTLITVTMNYYPQIDIVKSLHDWRDDADGVKEA